MSIIWIEADKNISLTQCFLQRLADHAREDVAGRTGAEGDGQLDRFGLGPGLAARAAGEGKSKHPYEKTNHCITHIVGLSFV